MELGFLGLALCQGTTSPKFACDKVKTRTRWKRGQEGGHSTKETGRLRALNGCFDIQGAQTNRAEGKLKLGELRHLRCLVCQGELAKGTCDGGLAMWW
jgi:hypothetical protein